jgi:hypothetical protein
MCISTCMPRQTGSSDVPGHFDIFERRFENYRKSTRHMIRYCRHITGRRESLLGIQITEIE